MTPAMRRKMKSALEALREELTGRGPARLEPNRTDEARAGGDDDAQPLNEMHQVIASRRNQNAASVVLRVDKALRKLRDEPEDFGTCEECGEDIAPARLQAMPYAEFCVPCQGRRDDPKTVRRKSLTDFL